MNKAEIIYCIFQYRDSSGAWPDQIKIGWKLYKELGKPEEIHGVKVVKTSDAWEIKAISNGQKGLDAKDRGNSSTTEP